MKGRVRSVLRFAAVGLRELAEHAKGSKDFVMVEDGVAPEPALLLIDGHYFVSNGLPALPRVVAADVPAAADSVGCFPVAVLDRLLVYDVLEVVVRDDDMIVSGVCNTGGAM